MFKKILLIVSVLTLLLSCEYKPIYSDLNQLSYQINITEFNGDKELNKFIIENLSKRNQKKSSERINIKINTEYEKNILAKNTAGSITNYQVKAITTFEIDKNTTTETLTIEEKFNYQKLSDKYEEKSYEKTIKRSMAISISQKLILKLSIIK
tara:strand:- start:939 stop:1397 length:459 start_codon:yes stop_codon:yes gene_type:complete